jgi:multicomponent Na+:H+ antiporter subunit D
MALYLFILIPLLAGIAVFLVPGRKAIWTALLLQLALLVMSVVNFIYEKSHGAIEFVLGDFEKAASITLWCDNFAAAMIILTALIFLVCFAFGLMDRFMNNKFVFFFLVLQSLVMTIFLSRDLFNLYVVTEVSTIVVAVLIMFKKDRRSMYDGMLYLVTNIAAMTFFLFGTAFVYKTFGTLDMVLIEAKMHYIENPGSMVMPFSLMMTGICLKCAFFPLFSWLPKAHATPSAPSIISAVLSGIYVKCGIFMFIRVREIFLPVIEMDAVFLTIGIITGITGFVMAIAQKDIKRILAFHTVSQMGLVLMGLASKVDEAYYGGLLHAINHAVFKSLLFLTAGIVISAYGTRNVTKIRGVFKRMPYVSVTAFAAMLGITGAPLFNGSISKYFIERGFAGSVTEYFIIFINLGTIISFIKISQIFFGDSPGPVIKTDIWKKISLTVMALLCLGLGLGGPVVTESIFNTVMVVDMHEYIRNMLIFFTSLGAGYLIYAKILKNTSYIKKGISKEAGVNGIAVAITLFFVFMAAASYITAMTG